MSFSRGTIKCKDISLMLQIPIGSGDLWEGTLTKKDMPELNHNLFRDDHSFPDSLHDLDRYFREGYVLNAIKLKTQFRNLR